VTKLMREADYGRGYRYPHEFRHGVVEDHASHLPEPLRDHLPARRFVQTGPRGWEAAAEEHLRRRREGHEDEQGG
jgi:putative ATPase